MKKISELDGESFCDVLYALSPILPMISEAEVVQAQIFRNYSDKISKARAKVAVNTTLLKSGDAAKKDEYMKNIEEANQIIKAEISGIFARDITKIIPALASKANRGCIFETLSILEGVPIEEVKKYPAPKLISKIKDVVKDADFKSFLDYAEKSDTPE